MVLRPTTRSGRSSVSLLAIGIGALAVVLSILFVRLAADQLAKRGADVAWEALPDDRDEPAPARPIEPRKSSGHPPGGGEKPLPPVPPPPGAGGAGRTPGRDDKTRPGKEGTPGKVKEGAERQGERPREKEKEEEKKKEEERPAGRLHAVVYIVDGDTVHIRHEGRREKVRLIGMDTPERGQEGFWRARKHLSALLAGRKVEVGFDVERRDRYRRLLCYLWTRSGGRRLFVNEQMVISGWARAYRYPPNTRYAPLFARRQKEAQSARRGVWAFERPPWRSRWRRRR